MSVRIASAQNVTEEATIASSRCSHCLMLPAVNSQNPFHSWKVLSVVDPVELWATRQRRPSASGKSIG
jgi:hypothetical protein